jgi:hypothetical protein
MIPYIKNIDVTKSFGKLVHDYGELRYTSGLTLGLTVGFTLGVATTILLRKK